MIGGNGKTVIDLLCRALFSQNNGKIGGGRWNIRSLFSHIEGVRGGAEVCGISENSQTLAG